VLFDQLPKLIMANYEAYLRNALIKVIIVYSDYILIWLRGLKPVALRGDTEQSSGGFFSIDIKITRNSIKPPPSSWRYVCMWLT